MPLLEDGFYLTALSKVSTDELSYNYIVEDKIKRTKCLFFIPALCSGPPRGQVEEMPDVQSKQNQLKYKHMQ